jgi:ribonuclease T1
MAGPRGKPGVPTRARQVLNAVRKGGSAPPGHIGGQAFANRERKLPASGTYLEYDVQSCATQPRGPERIVIDQTSGRAWYSRDHYRTFVEM